MNETLDCPESYHIDGTCPLMPGFSTVIELPGRLRSVRHLDAARFGASMSLPRFRRHPGYAASFPRRQSASASFGLRYSLRECNLRAL